MRLVAASSKSNSTGSDRFFTILGMQLLFRQHVQSGLQTTSCSSLLWCVHKNESLARSLVTFCVLPLGRRFSVCRLQGSDDRATAAAASPARATPAGDA